MGNAEEILKINGLGGWLLILGFHIFVGTLAIVMSSYELVYSLLFFTDFTVLSEEPWLYLRLTTNLSAYAIVLFMGLHLSYTYITKHHRFPLLCILYICILSVADLIYLIVLIVMRTNPEPLTLLNYLFGLMYILPPLAYLALWIAYLQKSLRVKNTFIKYRPKVQSV